MRVPTTRWHVITPEFHPRIGGVADHTERIASALAEAGDQVHVWCPHLAPDEAKEPPANFRVHRVIDGFRRGDLKVLDSVLAEYERPRTLLVQWVPHGYGGRSMNLPFCTWILRRSRAGDRIVLMVHEPGLPFSMRHLRWNLPALAHRLMAFLLLRAADRVWFSAPQWAALWQPYAGRKVEIFGWLPLPNGIPVVDDPVSVDEVRRLHAPDARNLVGCFGLFHSGVARMLDEWLPPLLAECQGCLLLLIGKGSHEYRERILEAHPEFGSRIRSTGEVTRAEVSLILQACDLLVQPFPGGVNTRRSSVIAALAHGVPVVTTRGRFTEPLWEEGDAISLIPEDEPEAFARATATLLADRAARTRLASGSLRLYDRYFDIRHAVAALRAGRSFPIGVS